MRIHSDILTPELLRKCLSEDERFKGTGAAIWRLNEHGSRKRARAFEVRIGADAGQDIHGKTRRPSMGGGYYHPHNVGDEDYTEKALTYAEWGFFLANVYAIDPNAHCTYYKNAEDFNKQTYDNGLAWGCRENNGHEPFYACDWAYFWTPDHAPVGV